MKVKNAFFIQRAAIDVLLLNHASALEICTYLVISKYSDKNGYYSGVGFKTIKERLGVGQKKAEAAITRLKSMEYAGQRLLFSLEEWIYLESGKLDTERHRSGWVRGWFESEYKSDVWLSNDVVGDNGGGDPPIRYLLGNGKDNHARLLLLMYKYCNKEYAGVNYKFMSVSAATEEEYQINDVPFFKSRLSDYHISLNIPQKYGFLTTAKEASSILDALRKAGFLSVSVSVIGNYNEPDTPKITQQPKANNKARTRKQEIAYNDYLKRIERYNRLKEENEGSRDSFRLMTYRTKVKGRTAFTIKLVKWLTTNPKIDFAPEVFEPLDYDETVDASKSLFTLDYKSAHNVKFDKTVCFATIVENITTKANLKPASRKGKFYKCYWWFNPDTEQASLIGIIMPSFTLGTKLSTHTGTTTTLSKMNRSNAILVAKKITTESIDTDASVEKM